MCAQFKKPGDADSVKILLSRVEQDRSVDGKGNATFDAFTFAVVVPALVSAISLNHSISEIGRNGIIHSALFEAGKAPTLTPENLLKEVKKKERSYLKQPRRSFVLSTMLSIKYFPGLTRLRLGETSVSFGRHQLKKFALPPSIQLQVKNHFSRPPAFATITRLRISARTPQEAAELGLHQLDLLRGIWNFFLLEGSFRISSGQPRPMNLILAGPVHTVHEPTGKLAIDTFWYENSYAGPSFAKSVEADWNDLRNFEKEVRLAFSKCPYAESLKQAFRRYANALDEAEWDTALIKLWGILELLTDMNHAKYSLVIKRTAFILRDRPFHREILKHIREYRNKVVHNDYTSRDREANLGQLRSYVEELILFHVRSSGRFRSLEEAGSFLDLPTEPELLERRLALTKRALQFRQRL